MVWATGRIGRLWFWIGSLMVMLSMLLMFGCTGNSDATGQGGQTPSGNNSVGSDAKETVKAPDPFELKIFAAGVASEEFDRRFRTRLEQKFPHITFTYLPWDSGNTLAEYVARGEIPDIVRLTNGELHSGYLELGLGYDMNEQIKKHQYDVSRFESVFVNGFIEAGRTGALYGLPVPPYFMAVMYYNKELFERFGVEPPRNGMDWDEAYALVNKMARMDGDTEYRGISINLGTTPIQYNEFSLPVLDPVKDGLSDFDKWKTIFDNYVRLYQIPNNKLEDPSAEFSIFNTGRVATSINVFSPYVDLGDIDWDMVSVPLIKGAPQQTGYFPPANLMITQQSKYKDEAFLVIMEILSEEIQIQDAHNGILPTLADQKVKDELGKGHPVFGSKNLSAVSYHKLGELPPIRAADVPWLDSYVGVRLAQEALTKAARGEMDVNSALRELDENLKHEVEIARSK